MLCLTVIRPPECTAMFPRAVTGLVAGIFVQLGCGSRTRFTIRRHGSEIATHAVVVDGNFTEALGSFPPDWEKRMRELHRFDNVVLCEIDSVDPAVSMVLRFSNRDREDIQTLAQPGLVDSEVFASPDEEALSNRVGDLSFVRVNLAHVKGIIETAGALTFQPSSRLGSTKSEISGDEAFEPDDASPDGPFSVPDSGRSTSTP